MIIIILLTLVSKNSYVCTRCKIFHAIWNSFFYGEADVIVVNHFNNVFPMNGIIVTIFPQYVFSNIKSYIGMEISKRVKGKRKNGLIYSLWLILFFSITF